MMIYYTEYPTGTFLAESDAKALSKSKAKVIYKESNSENGLPFVFVRNEYVKNESIQDIT